MFPGNSLDSLILFYMSSNFVYISVVNCHMELVTVLCSNLPSLDDHIKSYLLSQSDIVRCPGHAIHSTYSVFIPQVLELLHLDQNQVERRLNENYDPYRLQTIKRN